MVRYSTAGASNRENAQPLIIHYIKGTLAVAHNGNLTNAVDLREKLKYSGAIFQTTIDSETNCLLHRTRARTDEKRTGGRQPHDGQN